MIDVKLSSNSYTDSPNDVTSKFNLAGVSDGTDILANTELINSVFDVKETYSAVLLKFDGSAQGYKSVFETLLYKDLVDNYFYFFNSTVGDDIYTLVDTAKVIAKYGLYGSLIFFAFSIIMALNYFAVTILDKKKDIGTLRAMGASGKSVFVIYLCETALVSILSFIVSIPFTYMVCGVLNFLAATKIIDDSMFNLSIVTYL